MVKKIITTKVNNIYRCETNVATKI